MKLVKQLLTCHHLVAFMRNMNSIDFHFESFKVLVCRSAVSLAGSKNHCILFVLHSFWEWASLPECKIFPDLFILIALSLYL